MGTFTYHTELIDGVETEKPLPGKLHAFIQAYVLMWLGNQMPADLRAMPELNVIAGNDRLVPDVVVASRNAEYKDGDLVSSPLLVVEIMSPGQTIDDLIDKAKRLCQSDRTQCWIISPEDRRAWSYSRLSPTGVTEQSHSLAPFVGGISSKPFLLSEMWADLDN